MLVLPFFFAAVSGVGGGAVATVASVAEDAEVNPAGGELALVEARRFRGFIGAVGVAAGALEPSPVTGD